MSDLVCIQTFASRAEAELARGLLEQAGIPSIVSADDAGGWRPELILTTGGVRLLVHRDDAEEALSFLSKEAAGPIGETEWQVPAAASEESDVEQVPETPLSGRAAPWGLVPALVGAAISFLNSGLFACGCGFVAPEGLPGSVLAAVLTWWGFAKRGRRRLWVRCLVAICVVFATFMLLRNVHNVLWSGHDPWLAVIPGPHCS